MKRSFFGFINQWIHRRWDEDGYYGYQCVDWVKKFAKERLGKNITTRGNAIDLWNKGLGAGWTKVYNTADKIPPPGAIVFFSGPTKYGHVAVSDEGCTKYALRVIEQNAGNGNGDGNGENSIRRFRYDYITPKCLGWYV